MVRRDFLRASSRTNGAQRLRSCSIMSTAAVPHPSVTAARGLLLTTVMLVAGNLGKLEQEKKKMKMSHGPHDHLGGFPFGDWQT